LNADEFGRGIIASSSFYATAQNQPALKAIGWIVLFGIFEVYAL